MRNETCEHCNTNSSRAVGSHLSSVDVARLGTTLFVGLMMISVLFLSGCGKSRPTPVEVTGSVTFRGQPVQNALVNFIPKDLRPASGRTDAQGRFELMTYEPGDGAIVAEHSVLISKFVEKPRSNPKSPYPESVSVLPVRYSRATTTDLTAQVTADGANDFTFDLTP